MMEENQALLGKEFSQVRYQSRVKRPDLHIQHCYEDDGSSSDNSDWDESHSSWSSDCSASEDSVEWETEIQPNGELLFIKSELIPLEENLLEPLVSISNDIPAKEIQSKLSKWIRRRESKRVRSKLSVRPPANSKVTFRDYEAGETRDVSLVVDPGHVHTMGRRYTYSESLLGIVTSLFDDQQRVMVAGFIPNGCAAKNKNIKVGDWLRSINNEVVTGDNMDIILSQITSPSEVRIKLQRVAGSEVEQPGTTPIQGRSPLVRRLLGEPNDTDTSLDNQPIGVVVINLEVLSEGSENEIMFSFPSKCRLTSCRGSFITLYHLLPDFTSSKPISSTVLLNNHLAHIVYIAEGSILMLVALPDARCSVREAVFISQDMVTSLYFNHQTLKRCFSNENNLQALNNFFNLFFTHQLQGEIGLELVQGNDQRKAQFEEILPAAHWLPLPKEAQLQIDDALNELEANDFGEMREDIRSQRMYTILGSCLYHRGYLLASHLQKDDLLEVHSFCRQNGLLLLSKQEIINSLVLWRRVYPKSCMRGLHETSNGPYQIPHGDWFLLVVGKKHDLLVVLLESGGCTVKADSHPRPDILYVDEVEDTLLHLQKLGLTDLASKWISSSFRPLCTTPEEVLAYRANKKKDHLKMFSRTMEMKSSGSPSNKQSELTSILKRRGSQEKTQVGEPSEDSLSQATSNISEVSDENAPILGRRAERSRIEVDSDHSDDSDSDWESYKGSNLQGSISSGSDIRRSNFSELGMVIPSQLTTGPENALFHYVNLDTGEGVLMSSPQEVNHTSTKLKSVLNNFKKSAQVIHNLLENSIRFKKVSQDNSAFINKSLVAIKEHGVLMECPMIDGDGSKKAVNLNYWVTGRLFFTPQPREVYVCYLEDSPQNLVEIGFRLALGAAG